MTTDNAVVRERQLQASTGQEIELQQVVLSSAQVASTRTKRKGRYMSKRSGQGGSVNKVGKKWIGRFWTDVPGKQEREHKSVILGLRSEMTKPEARRKLRAHLEQIGVNTLEHLEQALHPKPVVTFNDLSDQWEKKRLPELRTSSQSTVPGRLKNHMRPFFGDKDVESLRTSDINDWIRHLESEGLAAKTITNCYKDFRSIVNWGRKEADRPKVTWYPSLPTLPDDEQRWFTQEEIKLIVDAATGKYRALFHLAGYTGMRCGELCALRVEDVKLEHGVIEVSRSVWNGVEGPTKNKKRRTVYIDSATVTLLREYLNERRTGRIFESRTGRPLTSQDINRKFLKPICKRLGIPVGTMHAFRHGRTSHMQASLMPRDFVLSQIGHSSLRVTSTYTHFAHDQKRNLVEQLLTCTQNQNLYSTV